MTIQSPSPARTPWRWRLLGAAAVLLTLVGVGGLAVLAWRVAPVDIALKISGFLAKVVLTGKALKAVGGALLIAVAAVVGLHRYLQQRRTR